MPSQLTAQFFQQFCFHILLKSNTACVYALPVEPCLFITHASQHKKASNHHANCFFFAEWWYKQSIALTNYTCQTKTVCLMCQASQPCFMSSKDALPLFWLTDSDAYTDSSALMNYTCHGNTLLQVPSQQTNLCVIKGFVSCSTWLIMVRARTGVHW